MFSLWLLIVIAYATFVLWMYKGFNNATRKTAITSSERVAFSIIIPCRNEEATLARCLDAIIATNYPRHCFEIILVDDHSEDGSWRMMEQYANTHDNIQALRLTGEEGKKSALTLAISRSSKDWIITRDADTTNNPHWLQSIQSAILSKKNQQMVILPVLPSSSYQNTIEGIFSLEFLSLMASGLACAAHQKAIIANGANFTFRKDWFDKLGGYKSHEHISSGDDVLFLKETVHINPQWVGVALDPDSAVLTCMPKDLNQWLDQRIRWGSKMTALTFDFTTAVSLLVLMANISLILSLITFFSTTAPLMWIVIVWATKCIPDYLFLSKVSQHFDRRETMKSFVLVSLLYPWALLISVILSIFKKPKWKGRTINI